MDNTQATEAKALHEIFHRKRKTLGKDAKKPPETTITNIHTTNPSIPGI
jgi:hypothetical protein